MTTPDPAQTPIRALASIDLGTTADETVGQATGRRIGGAVLMIVSGALTLGILAFWLLGPWLFGAPEWIWEFGDIFPFLAIVTFILTAVGFELLRRGRKRKGEAGPQATALMAAIDIVERLDGPDEPATVFSAGDAGTATRTGSGTTTASDEDGPDRGPLTTETRL